MSSKKWISKGTKNGVEKFVSSTNKRDVKFYTNFRNATTFSKKPIQRRIPKVTTQREAEEYVQKLKMDLSKTPNIIKRASTLDELAPKYFNKTIEPLEPTSKRVLRTVYDTWIKPSIGGMRLNKITREDIEAIVSSMLHKNFSSGYIRNVRTIINGIFKQSTIDLIPPTKLKKVSWTNTKKSTPKLSKITAIPFKSIIKCMYKNIMAIEDKNKRLILLLSLQTGRRITEVTQLTEESFNLEIMSAISLAQDTKTNATEAFPISEEIVELLNDPETLTRRTTRGKNGTQTNTIAYYSYETYSNLYKQFLANCAKVPTKILKGKSTHQSRHLFASTMSKEVNFTAIIADAMLSHKESETIAERYGEHITYEDKERYFQHYWQLLKMK